MPLTKNRNNKKKEKGIDEMKRKEKNQAVVSDNNTVQAGAPAAGRKKKKRRKAPIVIAALVIVFIVFRLVSSALTPEAAAIVTTTTPLRGSLEETISTSGMVVSGEKRVYFAPVNGTLAEVPVTAGDSVKTGELLVAYDMQKMEKSMKEAQLQQTKSQAGYNGLMADNSESTSKLSEANKNLSVLDQQIADHEAYLKTLQERKDTSLRETQQKLADESNSLSKRQAELQNKLSGLTPGSAEYQDVQTELNSVGVQTVENNNRQATYSSSDYITELDKEIADCQEALTEFREYKTKMESQKSSSESTVLNSYEQQQHVADKELAALSYEQAAADYQTAQEGVRAEFDGIVTECTAMPGAMVAEGTQLLTLENSSDVRVSFQASKNDIEKLALGQKADVTVAGRSYQGEVSKINRMATANQSSTPMVGVEVRIINPDEHIILGLDAKLTVLTNETDDALLIPVEAINADKEGDFLYVIEEGVAVRRPVVCGISSNEYTEIIEGVAEGDQIILTSYTDLTEGMAVTAIPAQ